MRELDRRQIIWAIVRSTGFIPSVDGRLLEDFEQESFYLLKGQLWLLVWRVKCRVEWKQEE